MKVLVVGGGGREHALAYKLKKSPRVTEVFIAPGNAGSAACGTNINIGAEDINALADFAEEKKIDLTVVGPEAPLVAGLADIMRSRGLRVFGPGAAGARLEGSKVFCKQLLLDAGIPTAAHAACDSYEQAIAAVADFETPLVVKADGLAAGKGVIICADRDEAEKAIALCMNEGAFGSAGGRVVIEEFLEGEEASFIAITDGNIILPMAGSQDHKRVFDNDEGPNTGGMGAYSPAPVLDDALYKQVISDILEPTLAAINAGGEKFIGVLYAGLMIKDGVAKVLEYNVRFGDPEAQPLLMRLKSDLFPILYDAAEGKLSITEAEWDDRAACCVVLASEGYPGSYPKGVPIEGLDRVPDSEDMVVFHAGTRLDDGRVVTSGGRVLGVTALGQDVKASRERAYSAIEKINLPGGHYRTDIALKALTRK